MSSVKVVDLNEEVKEEAPALEPIEEAPEPEITTEFVEEVNEEPKQEQEPKEKVEEPAPKVKPRAKPKPSDLVQCPDCFRSMTYKNLRYSHRCSPEPPPVKKQAKPKAKTKTIPKPPPEVYYSDSGEEEKENKLFSKPFTNQILKPQPINPVTALAQHYQLLQQQIRQQKQEKMSNLCQNIFSSKPKKR